MTKYNSDYSVREVDYNIDPIERQQKAKKNKNKGIRKILVGFLTVVVWGGLFYGGYLYATNYVQQSEKVFLNELTKIKNENESFVNSIITEINGLHTDMQLLNNEFLLVKEQLGYINEELQLTGETIVGSDQTKQALTSRMADLDRQLSELKAQLKRLEEAARVY